MLDLPPPDPRPATLDRLARLRVIADLDEAGEDVSHLSNLEIVQLCVERLWNEGRCKEASDLAARLRPYHDVGQLHVTSKPGR